MNAGKANNFFIKKNIPSESSRTPSPTPSELERAAIQERKDRILAEARDKVRRDLRHQFRVSKAVNDEEEEEGPLSPKQNTYLDKVLRVKRLNTSF